MDPLVVIALFLALVYSPFWLPVAFGIYAVVNRRFTLRLLFAFITCECAALAFNLWLQGLLDDRMP